ncbi:hypothetical protein [Amycolatopsis sp. NPDC049159]|uniref:hypothetical protein n=1 Tax=Amycolatopsis sp. NPDC049159 TaxID=3157210 RepID=UPI0033C36706
MASSSGGGRVRASGHALRGNYRTLTVNSRRRVSGVDEIRWGTAVGQGAAERRRPPGEGAEMA